MMEGAVAPPGFQRTRQNLQRKGEFFGAFRDPRVLQFQGGLSIDVEANSFSVPSVTREFFNFRAGYQSMWKPIVSHALREPRVLQSEGG